MLVRDVLSSVAIVAVIGLLLFGVSGIWPPLVAVESGSMEPNMERGDLIFVVADDRFVGDDPAEGTGVVTYENGLENGHDTFGQPGDVVVFSPNGNEQRTPIIHRAHFSVERGENWVDSQANPDYLGGATCDDLQTCPAPHDGFVTKGDANPNYDQVGTTPKSTIVSPDWISGKAMYRVPYLGHVRLTFDAIFGSVAPISSPALDVGVGGQASPPVDAILEDTPGETVAGATAIGITTSGVVATGITAVAAVTRRQR